MNSQTASHNVSRKIPDWGSVGKVLVVRLRSIGDTVLLTPSILALRKFLPDARIDILLESWVAPVLKGFGAVDNVIEVPRGSSGRMKTAAGLRKTGYDVVINFHGGPTSTLLARSAGARWRVGCEGYQFSFLYNIRLPSARAFWGRDGLHSVEQHLALAGFAGVPVPEVPRTRLEVVDEAASSVAVRLEKAGVDPDVPIALLHPASALVTKQWDPRKFASVADQLAERGLLPVAVAARSEENVVNEVVSAARTNVIPFSDLTLPEVTALAARSRLFVGNDSGIAHMAAAVDTPSVVIFGSSNRVHWRPWSAVPSRIVFREFECQPCPGYSCETFGDPRCILEVSTEEVIGAIDHLFDGLHDS